MCVGNICLFSETITVEGENFIAYRDLSLKPVDKRAIPSCDGVYGTMTLDYPHEWIEYTFTVEKTGLYDVRLICWGDWQKSFELSLTLTRANSENIQNIKFAFKGRDYGE
jgi:hypothetical protein